MSIDREVQRLILDTVFASYPDHAPLGTFHKLLEIVGDGDTLVANMLYLEEHGLITSGIRVDGDGKFPRNQKEFRITAKGIDFRLDDGGLSAIFDVVTIKIHQDSLSQIMAFITTSSLDSADKKKYLSRLQDLPFESTKHLVNKLLDSGLNRVPDALQLIRDFLG